MSYFKHMYGKQSPEFINGVLAGLEAFAWWKDGVQYVGTCGTTLKQAAEEAVEDLAEVPEEFKISKFILGG